MVKKFSRRKDNIKAEDIVPDKLYMVWLGQSLHACKVVCTEEPGWLRGYVSVEKDPYSSFFSCHVELVGHSPSRIVKVFLIRRGDDLIFMGFDHTPTLYAFDAEYLKRKITEAESEMAKLAFEVDVMKMALERNA